MKLFDTISGTITTLDTDGRGVLPLDGKNIHVPFAYPGDAITATLVKRQKGTLIGRLDSITTPSHERVHAPCPDATVCGGCPLQGYAYPAQLRAKTQLVCDAFLAAGQAFSFPNPTPAAELFFHRNRMDYVVSTNADGSTAVGLKEAGRWWRTRELRSCVMLSKDANTILEVVRAWIEKNAVACWNPKTHEGYVRYVVIREGKNTGERMVILVTHTGTLPAEQELTAALHPHCTSLYHAINHTITDISLGQEYRLLAGEAFLHEQVKEVTYAIAPRAFFQTNTAGATQLVDTVTGMLALTGKEKVLDLYCGVGFFSLQLASHTQSVLGIEMEEEAIVVAEKNARENKIDNITFRAEKSEALSWQHEKMDVVVVDPPRAGLHPDVISALLAMQPDTLLYISCNWKSLLKELPQLLEKYSVEKTALVDLFPHTPHIETVILFKKKSA